MEYFNDFLVLIRPWLYLSARSLLVNKPEVISESSMNELMAHMEPYSLSDSLVLMLVKLFQSQWDSPFSQGEYPYPPSSVVFFLNVRNHSFLLIERECCFSFLHLVHSVQVSTHFRGRGYTVQVQSVLFFQFFSQ